MAVPSASKEIGISPGSVDRTSPSHQGLQSEVSAGDLAACPSVVASLDFWALLAVI